MSGDELEPINGYIVVESGVITELGENRRGSDSDELIIPSFINSHVHTGDHIFRDVGMGLGLKKLVKSPDGLKHRLLAKASPEDITGSVSAAADEMTENGITAFLDFREQGVEGIEAFRKAQIKIKGLAFGRPLGTGREIGDEIAEIIRNADGIGLERAGIYDDEALSSIRSASSGKCIGIHISEARRNPGEMERVVDVLSADLLVHLTHSNERDLRLAADRGCSAVICPLANLHFGAGLPPIDPIIDEFEVVGIGTDNCMINSPEIFREMEIAQAITRRKRPREILKMATINGARALGISENTGSIEAGKAADIIMLRAGKNMAGVNDIHAAVAKRAGPQNIALVLKNGRPVFEGRPR